LIAALEQVDVILPSKYLSTKKGNDENAYLVIDKTLRHILGTLNVAWFSSM